MRLVIDVRRIVVVAQHAQPKRLFHEIVVLIRHFDDIPRRAGGGDRVSFIGQQRLEQFPVELKLKFELVDDAALNELVVQILRGSLPQRVQGGDVVLILFLGHLPCVGYLRSRGFGDRSVEIDHVHLGSDQSSFCSRLSSESKSERPDTVRSMSLFGWFVPLALTALEPKIITLRVPDSAANSRIYAYISSMGTIIGRLRSVGLCIMHVRVSFAAHNTTDSQTFRGIGC